MCGIAGIISDDTAEAKGKTCHRMVTALAHRGPDGQGVLVQDKVGFAHTRLAIVDLSAHADQPMRSLSSGNTIVFNGEIYNFKELRRRLIGHGANFKTASDTEVLLAAYDQWGEGFVEELNGIFAFALHDVARNCVLLGRDRLGVKPLYWVRQSDRIIFGSEVKSLAASGHVKLCVSQAALAEYLTFQNNFRERTLFQGVELFPAGSLAKVDLLDHRVTLRKYWQPSFHASDGSPESLRTALHAALEEAVRSQLDADVPVNSFLSGGIDSSALATLASGGSARIKTFTCGFILDGVTENEMLFDERAVAKSVAETIGSEHHEMLIGPNDFLEGMHTWAWHAEEPRVGSSFPNFCVSRLASDFTKVCLSGTGGDELFAGYPWRYQAALAGQGWESFANTYFGFWNRMVSSGDLYQLTGGHRDAEFAQAKDVFYESLGDARKRVHGSDHEFVDAALIFEMETFLHGLLVSEDKASMAHGLEVRVPLLDNSIIDLAMKIPAGLKLSGGSSQGAGTYGSAGFREMPRFTNGKMILRDVLSPYVSPAIAGGRKQGFSPPFETWFRREFRPWIEGDVLGSASPLRDHIDMDVARRIWSEHRSGQKNHRLFVWGIIALYLCMASFMIRANA